LLASAYARRADVLNRGYSGYNTTHYLEILPRILGQRHQQRPPNDAGAPVDPTDRGTVGSVDILFCTVFLGANDASLPGDPQNVPIDQYRLNLQKIVSQIRLATNTATDPHGASTVPSRAAPTGSLDESAREGAFPIILIAPPPVDEAAWTAARSLAASNRTNRRTRTYGNCVRQVAAMTRGCAFLDAWELLEGDDPENLSKYLSDGLHLNELGNRRLCEGLTKLIAEEFPHLAPMTDGNGKYGTAGVPLEEELWKVRCGLPLTE
jgi:lysophospholipase L1-like esterase